MVDKIAAPSPATLHVTGTPVRTAPAELVTLAVMLNAPASAPALPVALVPAEIGFAETLSFATPAV